MIDVKKLRVLSPTGIYCNVAVPGINVNTLRLTLNGSPWWGHSGGSIETIITGNVKRILKVDWPYVKTVINVEG